MSAAEGSSPPQAWAVLGPTGSGKSRFAMQLARALPAEIISVDSAQVYRGLDIGTAKPDAEERREVVHHLIDIREPEESYSAGEFRRDALALIPQIHARGRLPLLVGGTMLYFRALFHGLAELPRADPAVRARIDERAREQGWPAMHAELSRRDPRAATRIAPNDAQRIQRALEVIELTGLALDEIWGSAASDSPQVDWRIVILEPVKREQLHAELAVRLERMVAGGFVEEVRALLARGTLHEDSPVLRLVGYRQFLAHCRGEQSLANATQRALHATRQLAKRQMTWLRSPKLLPVGVSPTVTNAFDSQVRERLLLHLIQCRGTPR